jgi:DNA polymerase alpha subunit A
MRNGEIELDKYIITKSLTKQPEDYPDGKNQHYIQVRPCASSSVSES